MRLKYKIHWQPHLHIHSRYVHGMQIEQIPTNSHRQHSGAAGSLRSPACGGVLLHVSNTIALHCQSPQCNAHGSSRRDGSAMLAQQRPLQVGGSCCSLVCCSEPAYSAAAGAAGTLAADSTGVRRRYSAACGCAERKAQSAFSSNSTQRTAAALSKHWEQDWRHTLRSQPTSNPADKCKTAVALMKSTHPGLKAPGRPCAQGSSSLHPPW